MEWIAVLVGGGLAVFAFVAFFALFCSTNTKDEQHELRVGSRFAESCIGPRPTMVNGWGTRPEAEPFDGSDLRCWTQIPRRETA